MVVPAATPVTTPVVPPTVAVPVDELDHVPPETPSVRVMLEPGHTVVGPLIAVGVTIT